MNGENFSPFTFRSFNVNTVQMSNLYYVPELETSESRPLEFEMDVDDKTGANQCQELIILLYVIICLLIVFDFCLIK